MRATVPITVSGLKVACSQCNLVELCLPFGMSDSELSRLDDLVGARRKVKRQHCLYRAGDPFEAIYAIRELGNPWLVGAVLLFVTSPGEELFWRGYIQRQAMRRLGQGRGTAVGVLLYGAVHLASGNIMLVMAAWVAGLFWCALYRWRGSLTACIVSHALWTVGVFLLFPIR